MAIDFGRAVQGIATGYLQAKIRNTEANDALKANTLMRVGETLIGETIPNAITAEKERKTNYDMLASRYTPEFAEVADVSGYTLDATTMKKLEDDLKANNLNEEKLKNANFATDFNTRYNTRVMSAEEKYNPILKQLGVDNIGALGYNTVEALVKPTTETTKDTMTDTVTQTPIKFDSMQLGDYLQPQSKVLQIPENEFGRVASSFRNFENVISFDPQGNVRFNFSGTKDVEYNALRNVTNQVSGNFYNEDQKKVNVGMAVEEANKILTEQTENHIRNVVDNYQVVKTPKPGGATSQASGQLQITEEDLLMHIAKMGTKSEQRYYALSFPAGVTLQGTNQEVRQYLLDITR